LLVEFLSARRGRDLQGKGRGGYSHISVIPRAHPGFGRGEAGMAKGGREGGAI